MKNKYVFIRFILLTIGGLIALSTACFAQDIRTYKVLQSAPPQLDGKFDDACWVSADWQSAFNQTITGKGIAPIQTKFAVVRDAKALYFAIECLEPEMDKLLTRITANDGNLWEDDCVELLFDPVGNDTLQHLIINSAGVKYDSDLTAGGASWNPAWETATSKASDRWCIEVRVPFASLRVKKEENTIWRANVCRERQAGQRQLSGWSDPKGDFQTPKNFGLFVFGNYSSVVKQNLLPEWKQISTMAEQFKGMDNEQDKQLFAEYQRTAAEVDPLFGLLNRSDDITAEQYTLLDKHSRTSFQSLKEMINIAEIHRLLEEGTK